jgi:membrane-associated phospholipid phosphatase
MYERTYDGNVPNSKSLHLFLILLSIIITISFWTSVCLAQTGARSDPQYTVSSVYWNRVARNLVSEIALDPVNASRIYAFLSIAQHDAAAAAAKQNWDRRADPEVITRVAVMGSSFAVLSNFFPSANHQLKEAYGTFAKAADHTKASGETIAQGATLGRGIAGRVLRRANNDDSDQNREMIAPGGLGHWRTEPDRPPLRPYWGQVRPLLMESVDRFVAKAPPAAGSLSFRLALARVKFLAGRLDREQWQLVQYWADGVGTPTPPGHWNEIAAELIAHYRFSERSAARTLALLNIALFDAGIACWRAKYTYWLARPSQMDPSIRPNISVPNFPSYTSGHASFSGAAAEILSHVFPGERARIRKLAEEAAISRVYARVHFPFDSDEGLAIGRRIGRLAVKLERYPGELLPHLK